MFVQGTTRTPGGGGIYIRYGLCYNYSYGLMGPVVKESSAAAAAAAAADAARD